MTAGSRPPPSSPCSPHWSSPAAAASPPEYSLRRMLKTVWPALLVLALAPALWLLYNGVVFGNALEFWNGPYSARAIEAKHRQVRRETSRRRRALHLRSSSSRSAPRRTPRKASPAPCCCCSPLSASPSPSSAGARPGSSCCSGCRCSSTPCRSPTEASPSSSRSGVPGRGTTCAMACSCSRRVCRPRSGRAVRRLPVETAGAPLRRFCRRPLCRSLLHARMEAVPLTLQEARVNARTRVSFERALAGRTRCPSRGERLLMYTSDYAGALQDAGIHERDVINESNWQVYGSTRFSLPPRALRIVVAIGSDPVARRRRRASRRTHA